MAPPHNLERLRWQDMQPMGAELLIVPTRTACLVAEGTHSGENKGAMGGHLVITRSPRPQEPPSACPLSSCHLLFLSLLSTLG
jgi:hypothetical protein